MTEHGGFRDAGGNTVHATAVIGARVRLGRGNTIAPGAVIGGDTVLGDGNYIGAHVVIGCPPELRGGDHDHRWLDEALTPGVVIGSGGVFREGCQIHSGSKRPTRIGDEAFLMNQVYVAHDGTLADRVTAASQVALAGEVTVGRGANLGMGTLVHQGRRIGAYAMLGMGSVVTRDVPDGAKAYGNPARVHGCNTVGLSRAGFSEADVAAIEAWLAAGAAPGRLSGDLLGRLD